MSSAAEAEASEIEALLGVIHEQCGHDFRGYERSSVQRRVRAILAKSELDSPAELGSRLADRPALIAAVVDDLTVQVSDMFRDPEVFRFLLRSVLPTLRTYPQLKIWHAGCASGEEVYSMAILLHEAGLYERAQIYATDTSPSAIARAKQGTYSAKALPRFASAYRQAGGTGRLEDYFTIAYGGIVVRPELRKNVFFFQHDLCTDHALGEMQLVACRNVLIYFDTELRERVLGMFGQSLCAGGFLCLGSSECLPPLARPKFSVLSPSERIYRWKGET